MEKPIYDGLLAGADSAIKQATRAIGIDHKDCH